VALLAGVILFFVDISKSGVLGVSKKRRKELMDAK